MWNGRFFERSDILTHQLALDLRHYLDDCPSISLNTETQMMFDLDISDGEMTLQIATSFQSQSESTTHSGSRSNITIVSSTGICQHSI